MDHRELTQENEKLREYVDRLSRFYMDNLLWSQLSEEARTYLHKTRRVLDLSSPPVKPVSRPGV